MNNIQVWKVLCNQFNQFKRFKYQMKSEKSNALTKILCIQYCTQAPCLLTIFCVCMLYINFERAKLDSSVSTTCRLCNTKSIVSSIFHWINIQFQVEENCPNKYCGCQTATSICWMHCLLMSMISNSKQSIKVYQFRS